MDETTSADQAFPWSDRPRCAKPDLDHADRLLLTSTRQTRNKGRSQHAAVDQMADQIAVAALRRVVEANETEAKSPLQRKATKSSINLYRLQMDHRKRARSPWILLFCA